jgi:hypothetical protein
MEHFAPQEQQSSRYRHMIKYLIKCLVKQPSANRKYFELPLH